MRHKIVSPQRGAPCSHVWDLLLASV